MNKLLAILAFSLLATAWGAQAAPAADKHGANEPEERVEEHLDKSDAPREGTSEAPGGGAEPTENWFGCSPEDGNAQECEKQGDPLEDEDAMS